MLGSLAAIAVVVVGGFFALRQVAVDEAERDTRLEVQQLAQVVEPQLTARAMRGDPAALAALDDVVAARILGGPIVRVKIWTPDGTIIYSDEAALIGRRYPLGEDELRILREGGSEAELSDLTKPENVFERDEGQLLEAHTPVRSDDGQLALFEIYERFSSVNSNGRRLLRALAPPLVVALLVLLLAQVPLAWSLARRLQRGQREREALLVSAIDASNAERSRIAGNLHDGVVQDLAGLAFGLSAAADRFESGRVEGVEGTLRGAVERLRLAIRSLRTLLVEIHPPNLEASGLEVALSDLLSPLEANGIDTKLDVQDGHALGPDAETLMYRVAQEAVRNVVSHSNAKTVTVDVHGSQPNARLVVEDDGEGFDEEERSRRQRDGHVGLSLLEQLVSRAGGTLTVTSRPGEGTRVELEVPSR